MSDIVNLMSSYKRHNNLDDFQKQLHGYKLTTAEILYHMPDHQKVLQSFIWQEYDIDPEYPILYGFIDFWKKEIDGPLHSVFVATKQIIGPTDYSHADVELLI